MLEILGALLVGIVAGIVGTQIWVALQVNRALRELGVKSIDEIDVEGVVSAARRDRAKEPREVTCEYENGQILIFDTKTKQFLAQGDTFDSATDALAERLGAGGYQLNFDMEPEALARVQREIESIK
jgi:hypothetical protein